MRIQNNITALNTHRQYTINNDNVAKSAEKLSSGFKINRAADDAAGLAISEKMRSQIRGLNMATKNSQDAISLVQTAEGALQETHSMLQRMNELAVQAATGTNQDFDKVQAAKEFEQLKREINDVAESTTFNNMKILDGSLSYTGYQRSAATAGVNVTTSDEKVHVPAADAPPLAGATTTNSVPTTGQYEKLELTLDTSMAVTNAGGAAAAKTDSITVGSASPVTVTVTATGTPGNNQTIAQLLADPAKKDLLSITASGYTVESIDATTGKVTLVKDALPGTAGTDGGTSATITASDGVVTAVNVAQQGKGGNPAVAEYTTITKEAVEGLAEDDVINIGGTNYTIGAGENDVDALMAAINADTTLSAKVTASKDAATGNLVITAKNATSNGDTRVTTGAPTAEGDYDYTHTIEIDPVKMKKGDKFEIKVGTESLTFEYNGEVTDTTTAANKLAQAAKESGTLTNASVEVKGNALVIKTNEASVTAQFKKDETAGTTGDATIDNKAEYGTNAIRIQVGALEDEQLNISIDSMNTAGLQLDGQNLFTQNSSGNAITATRTAINRVSDLRATLGAMQNRLDHKIANLKVSSENLSAAESRIRDVDMASEMTNFTKNNILSQAATAMLAQANALPQNVLSLLG